MSKSTEELVDLYLEEVGKKHSDKISVRFKSESKLLKLVRPVVELFNKKFWDDYVTTVGTTIWVPEDWFVRGDAKSRLSTLAHEIIHIQQYKREPFGLHNVLYAFPQCLAVPVLLYFGLPVLFQ